jgi:uncharacterized protein
LKPYLWDVNLLIALAWPQHVHHWVAQNWFSKKRRAGFRTCPLTQTGFVRVSSNPKFTSEAVSPMHAVALLEHITAMPEHQFWPATLDFAAAIHHLDALIGHRQVADAYLLGLARAHKGTLATLDRGTLSLGNADAVELVR